MGYLTVDILSPFWHMHTQWQTVWLMKYQTVLPGAEAGSLIPTNSWLVYLVGESWTSTFQRPRRCLFCARTLLPANPDPDCNRGALLARDWPGWKLEWLSICSTLHVTICGYIGFMLIVLHTGGHKDLCVRSAGFLEMSHACLFKVQQQKKWTLYHWLRLFFRTFSAQPE